MEGELPVYNLNDISEHKSKESAWVVIHNVVYDVTKYLDEHPGGSAILLERSGKDATKYFEDIGHSSDARAKLPGFAVGKLELSDVSEHQTALGNKTAQCPCSIM